jgi:hypothetical protein
MMDLSPDIPPAAARSEPARRAAAGLLFLSALPVALAALAVMLIALPVAAAAGEKTTVDGVVHVHNGAKPAEGTVTRQLEELWRAGGEEDDIFFGSIPQVLADEQGNLYLLDGQLSEVKVYGPDGTFLRTLSREGEGPGEVRRPADMFFLPDGTLALVQSFPGKVVEIDREGNPAGGMMVGDADPSQGRMGVLVFGRCRGGNIVLSGMHMSFNPSGGMDQKFFVSQCDANGVEQHRYLEKSYPVNFQDFVLDEAGIDFIWSGRFALGPDGRVYMAPDRDRFAIQVLTPDGRLERVIERDVVPRKRTAEEKHEAELNMRGIGGSYPVQPREVTVLDTDPVVSGMYVDDDGQLWVATSTANRNLPSGILAAFDVFDAEGDYVRRLQLAGPGDPERDGLNIPSPDRIVVTRGSLDAWRNMQGVSSGEAGSAEEVAPLEVIVYRVAD